MLPACPRRSHCRPSICTSERFGMLAMPHSACLLEAGRQAGCVCTATPHPTPPDPVVRLVLNSPPRKERLHWRHTSEAAARSASDRVPPTSCRSSCGSGDSCCTPVTLRRWRAPRRSAVLTAGVLRGAAASGVAGTGWGCLEVLRRLFLAVCWSLLRVCILARRVVSWPCLSCCCSELCWR